MNILLFVLVILAEAVWLKEYLKKVKN